MSFIKDTEKNIIIIINIIHPQVSFIKDIKKNTSLSDEDAAIIAASKVRGVFSGRKIFCSGRKPFCSGRKIFFLWEKIILLWEKNILLW